MINRSKMRFSKNDITIIFFFLFIFYITFSHALNSVISRLLLYSFLAVTFLNVLKKKKIAINNYMFYYLVFTVVSFFTIFYAVDKDKAITVTVDLVVVLIVLVAFSQYTKSITDIHKTLDFFAYSGVLMILYILLFRFQEIGSGRLGEVFFGSAIRFSYIIVPLTMIYLWKLVFREKREGFFVIDLILTSISFYFCIMSGGRKSVMLPIMFLIIILLLKYAKKPIKSIFIFTTLILLGLSFFDLVMTNPTIYNTFGYRMESFINFLSGSTVYDSSITKRLTMIDYAIQLFKDKPIIGYGMDNFSYYYASISGYEVYSHNNFLELLVSGGIIMFTSYYAIYLYIIVKLLRIKNSEFRELKVFFIAFTLTTLASDLGSISYKLIQNHLILLLSIVLISLNERYKKNIKFKNGEHDEGVKVN